MPSLRDAGTAHGHRYGKTLARKVEGWMQGGRLVWCRGCLVSGVALYKFEQFLQVVG